MCSPLQFLLVLLMTMGDVAENPLFTAPRHASTPPPIRETDDGGRQTQIQTDGRKVASQLLLLLKYDHPSVPDDVFPFTAE